MASTTNCSAHKNHSCFILSRSARQARASSQHLLDARTSFETVLKGHRIIQMWRTNECDWRTISRSGICRTSRRHNATPADKSMNRKRRKHSLFTSPLSDRQFTTHVVDCFAGSSTAPFSHSTCAGWFSIFCARWQKIEPTLLYRSDRPVGTTWGTLRATVSRFRAISRASKQKKIVGSFAWFLQSMWQTFFCENGSNRFHFGLNSWPNGIHSLALGRMSRECRRKYGTTKAATHIFMSRYWF